MDLDKERFLFFCFGFPPRRGTSAAAFVVEERAMTVTNEAVFQRAARGEMTPREAAEVLLKQDAQRRAAARLLRKPAWLPRPIWTVATVIALVTFS